MFPHYHYQPTVLPSLSVCSSSSPISLKSRPIPSLIPQLNINVTSNGKPIQISVHPSAKESNCISPSIINDGLCNILTKVSITTSSEMVSEIPIEVDRKS